MAPKMILQDPDLLEMSEPAIILAKDLTPSDTIHFERSLILGFCTSSGGKTSHTAIPARALGVPAVLF
jgi:phosphocarrier protein FPr